MNIMKLRNFYKTKEIIISDVVDLICCISNYI